jgi:hypothetical protein
MRKNKLGYLGLLGLLGLLGIAGNTGFFGFFGAFGFFAMLKNSSDERIDRNIDRASRNAFVFDIIVSSSLLSYVALSETLDALPVFIVALFQGIVVFGLSFYYYGSKGE